MLDGPTAGPDATVTLALLVALLALLALATRAVQRSGTPDMHRPTIHTSR
jgi:hypothetical protein